MFLTPRLRNLSHVSMVSEASPFRIPSLPAELIIEVRQHLQNRGQMSWLSNDIIMIYTNMSDWLNQSLCLKKKENLSLCRCRLLLFCAGFFIYIFNTKLNLCKVSVLTLRTFTRKVAQYLEKTISNVLTTLMLL